VVYANHLFWIPDALPLKHHRSNSAAQQWFLRAAVDYAFFFLRPKVYTTLRAWGMEA
jgi:hypothetical protein